MTTKTTTTIILTIFCCFNLAYGKPQYQEPLKIFWKDAKPGALLSSLDTITSYTRDLMQAAVPKEEINTKVVSPNKVANNILLKRIGESSVESLEEKHSYDYDRAYEDFVKKYFDDSLTDALSAGISAEVDESEQQDAEASSGEVESGEEYEPFSDSSNKSTKKEKCKNVARGKQNCFICKNSRNGEISESCSYNEENKPQNYEFEKQKSYRKYRTTPNDSGDERNDQQLSKAKKNSSLKKPIKRKPIKSNATTSSCVIKETKDKICYLCENSRGDKVTKCYAEEMPSGSSNEQTGEREK